MNPLFAQAFARLPLVAILRGVTPEEVESMAAVLYDVGFRLIEVPLNSPRPLASISRLARLLPIDALVGAGTVLNVESAIQVESAGGRLIVMPHADVSVIRHVTQRRLACVPGAATPTEALACAAAGADALKLFPAELVTPPVLKAMRAVLPPGLPLLPVGGITPEGMAAYRAVGAAGFGLGGALYTPGMDSAELGRRARAFVAAWSAA